MTGPIQVECPHCFSTLKLKNPSSIGKKVRCPKCSDPFVVEAMDEPEDDFLADIDLGGDDYGAPQALPQPGRRKLKRSKKPRSPVGSEAGAPVSYDENNSNGLGVMVWILAGMAGGAVGMAIWVGVGYLLLSEIGYVAMAVGGLVGLGVRFGSGGHEGFFPGLTAAIIAIISILLGKYLVVVLLVNWVADMVVVGGEKAEIELYSEPVMISRLADEIVEEYERDGRELKYHSEKIQILMGNDIASQYPQDVWQEATERWGEKSEEERLASRKIVKEELNEKLDEIQDEFSGVVFLAIFSPWDILWFLLATSAAFRVAAGDSL